jgi:hypothetical protein
MRRQILLFLLLAPALFALDITDPLGEIYDDIQVWHEAGLIDTLPSLRPYPAQVLVAALEEVTARTSLPEAERVRARKYLEELTGTKIDFVWGGEAQLKSGEDEEYLWGIAGMDFNTWFSDYIALNGHWVAMAKYEGDGYYAGGEAGPIDTFDDNAEASIRGRTIELRQILTNSFSVGTDSLYFQAGIHRSSYGPVFDNGAVLGGYAHYAPTFNVIWDEGGKFGLTTTYMDLTATDYYGDVDDPYSDKHMVMQTYTYRPNEWAQFEFLQSIVYGQRFDLTYFVPFSFLFYNQNLTGYEDNSFMGLSMALDLPHSVGFNSVLYIDDAHFNDLIRGNIETMFKAAVQGEVTWTPMSEYVRRVSLDYLAITPYTFSHKSDRFSDEAEAVSGVTADYLDWLSENANYLNYTTYGDPLGPVLDPNSDRLTLKYSVRPLPQLDVNLIGRMIRHGNPSEDELDDFDAGYNDGTIFDDGYDENEDHTFKEFKFLTQDTLEYTFVGGFDLSYTFDFAPSRLSLLLGYRLEHIRNQRNIDGDPVDGDNETSHYLMGGFIYSYSF